LKIRPDGQDPTSGMTKDLLRHRPKQKLAKVASAMCANHHQVDCVLVHDCRDDGPDVAFLDRDLVADAFEIALLQELGLQILRVESRKIHRTEHPGASDSVAFAGDHMEHMQMPAISLCDSQTSQERAFGALRKISRDKNPV
jgi:hypothetical protein